MVYLFYIYKHENKRTLEKKHSPEVNSNHNEEHITNPCGFVTHIYILVPGKACSSLTPDKQTEVRLSNHRNRNQHQNLHRNAKKGAKSDQ